MLGTEKRVRSMYGDAIDDETVKKGSGPSTLAFVAFFLAIVGLALAVGQYTNKDNDRLSKVSAALTAAQSQVTALELRLEAVENRPDKGQELVLDSLVNDLGQKAGYLAGQPLTDKQRQALKQALTPLTK